MTKILVFYVGTHRLSAILGDVTDGGVHVLNHSEILDPDGFQKGEVAQIEKALVSTTELLSRFDLGDEATQIPAYVLLSDSHLKMTSFSSSIYYSGYPRVITSREVQQVIEQTRTVAPLSLEDRILEVVPEFFWVDDLTGVQDPVGLEARRLAVSLQIYSTKYSAFRNLARLFESLELNLKGYYPKTLVISKAVLNTGEREGEALVMDFSDGATHLILNREGKIVRTKSLDLGSHFLTDKIAETWKVGVRDGQRLKEQFGSLEENLEFREELVPLVERNGQTHHPIKREDFHKSFLGFADELFNRLDQEIRDLLASEKMSVPTLVLTGGGVKLEGLVEYLSRRFSFPVRLGTPRQFRGAANTLLDPSWAGPLGLLSHVGDSSSGRSPSKAKENTVERAFFQLKEWLVAYF